MCGEAGDDRGGLRVIPASADEAARVQIFLNSHDMSSHTREAMVYDLRKFAGWFSSANHEPFSAARETMRDVLDFREHSSVVAFVLRAVEAPGEQEAAAFAVA